MTQIHILLNHHANVSLVRNNQSALSYALFQIPHNIISIQKVVRLLLRHGANPYQMLDNGNKTPFSIAFDKGYHDINLMMLECEVTYSDVAYMKCFLHKHRETIPLTISLALKKTIQGQ